MQHSPSILTLLNPARHYCAEHMINNSGFARRREEDIDCILSNWNRKEMLSMPPEIRTELVRWAVHHDLRNSQAECFFAETEVCSLVLNLQTWHDIPCVHKDGRFVPRNISVDTEPTVLDEVRVGEFASIFHPDYLINGKEDAGSLPTIFVF